MLAWQNKTSLLKQPKQVNHVIKKNTICSGISSKLTIQILSSPMRFTRWGSKDPRLFCRSMFLAGDVRKSLPYYRSLRKNGHPLKTINHDQFLAKYSNRRADQPLGKHYMVKLDLDGLRKARYPRITKRATKRVSVLSLCCDQRQEMFVNLGHFQTTSN